MLGPCCTNGYVGPTLDWATSGLLDPPGRLLLAAIGLQPVAVQECSKTRGGSAWQEVEPATVNKVIDTGHAPNASTVSLAHILGLEIRDN